LGGSESFRAVISRDRRKPGAASRCGASGFRSSHPVRFNACCVVSVPRVFAACCGTGRMLHLVCGACRVAHWLSSTMLRACCLLCAARCSPHTKCGGAVCFLLHLAFACVLLHVVCCLLHVVCCMRCLVLPSSARCLLHAACCLDASLPRCLLSMVLFQNSCCMPHVARCMLHAAGCVARRCCPLHVALSLAHVV
jgi:hypothetical protein